MDSTPSRQIGNRILSGLSPQEFQSLLPALEPIPLVREKRLYEIDDRFDYAYFPNGGMISLVAYTADGESLEVGVVGFEGVVGLPLFFGEGTSPCQAVVQAEATGNRMKADAFLAAALRPGGLQTALLNYTHALLKQITQSALCSRYHSIESRLARWLLITKTQVCSSQFYLTQEFLGHMLGAHRPSVTVAAGILQNAGLIRYSRGNITVLDAEGLEAASCECYRIIVEALGLDQRS